jgi:glycosyltransferase involved in cell wall biosynthesis
MIIGDGPEREKIEQKIDLLDLRGAVAITGYCEDVRAYIESCNVMVLTSHVETFSIAAIEAMSRGKPMILTRAGGAEEQITHGENGYLYEPGDVESLAQLLRQLADPEQQLKMGERAAQVVRERFTVESMAGKFATLIDRLVTPDSPGGSNGNSAAVEMRRA